MWAGQRGVTVDGFVATPRAAVPASTPSDEAPSADPDAGTLDFTPPNPQAGRTFAATFEPTNERGGYFILEQWSGSEWLPAAFLLESDVNGGSPTWASTDGELEILDSGVSGEGPDGLVMPDTIDAGVWRLCTANAPDDVCARLTVEA